MTDRRELADRLEAVRKEHLRLATWNRGKDRPARVAFHHDAAQALTEAARLLREPVAGEVEELRAVRDALMNAGGASPSDGMTRFSFWSPFYLAVSSLRARLDDEGKGA